MKTIFTLLAVCFSYVTFASHCIGGYIVAKQVSGRQYQITTVLLTDPNSPANMNSADISLDYGDGKTETVTRTAVSTEDGIQRNTYTIEHIYATDGVFTISFSNPNLPANIVNLNGGFSENTPFKTTCLIRVNNTVSGMQSASPLAFEFVKGCLNKTSHYNPTFIGGDGYTVVQELVTEHPSLPNYNLPESSSINPYSGMLTFTPQFSGLYLFAFKITSYQNGILMTQSHIIQLYKISEAQVGVPTIDYPETSAHPQGWQSRVVTPNQSVNQLVTFTGTGDPFTVEVYSELLNKGATSSISKPTTNSAVAELNWAALPAYERTTPYFITYRYRSSNLNMIDDYNIAFYHGAPINTGVDEETSENQAIILYPNPAFGATQCYFVFSEFQKGQLTVYDVLGKSIQTEAIDGKTYMLETRDLKPGMYTYRYVSQSGENFQGKLQLK